MQAHVAIQAIRTNADAVRDAALASLEAAARSAAPAPAQGREAAPADLRRELEECRASLAQMQAARD